VKFGRLELGRLAPGRWREVSWWEVAELFPAAVAHPARSRVKRR
jgi:16S rRNA U516 pseudouridylate synthase RsuA-like enzyme